MELVNTKKVLILGIFCLLLILSLVASYYYFIPPLNNKIAQAEEQLTTEKKLLEVVQSQQQQVEMKLSPYELQLLLRQVPVRPLVDQFILDLEKAEIYSDSMIVNYGFADEEFSGVEVSSESQNNQTEANSQSSVNNPTEADSQNSENNQAEADAQSSENNQAEADAQSSENNQAEADTQSNENSHRVTVTMSVISPGYEELLNFLERIEQLERVTKIDELSFSGYPEVTMVEQTAEEITFSIAISTFYLPELEQFSQFLPKINYPGRSQRFNPLYYGVKEENFNEIQ